MTPGQWHAWGAVGFLLGVVTGWKLGRTFRAPDPSLTDDTAWPWCARCKSWHHPKAPHIDWNAR